MKEILEKLSKKLDQIFEQLVKETSKLEENKIENIFQQFEKLSLGKKPKTSVEYKINTFEPRNLEIKPWKLCGTLENPDFLSKGKMVISVKIRNFSRSRMMKRTSPLESSREILLPRRISSNSEIVGISHFSRHVECGTLGTLRVAQEAPRVKLWESQTLSSSGAHM